MRDQRKKNIAAVGHERQTHEAAKFFIVVDCGVERFMVWRQMASENEFDIYMLR